MKKCKCRWYVANLSLPYNEFIDRIKNLKYSDDSGYGFDMYEFTDTSVEFKFIEKKERTEISADPFNNDVVNLIVLFSSFFVSFTLISEGNVLIKIKEPPPSLKKFIEVINLITNFNFTISKVDIVIEDVYKYFTGKSIADRFVVLKASLKNITINKKTFASCEFSSADNAFYDIQEYFKDKKYHFDKIQISLRHLNSDEFVEASSSGLLTHSVNLSDKVDRYILGSLTL